MPRVWNKRDPRCPANAMYVGRPSQWGNPYVIGRDGNRDEVIQKYQERLDAMDPAFLREWLSPLVGEDQSCWCSPAPCHADILLKLANS